LIFIKVIFRLIRHVFRPFREGRRLIDLVTQSPA
jgi:hypothetical protein